MDDLNTLLTLAEAAQTLPTRPNRATVWRWATDGVIAADGSRVRLKTIRVGRCVLTRADWIIAFGEAVETRHRAARTEQRRLRRRSRSRRGRDEQRRRDEETLDRRGVR